MAERLIGLIHSGDGPGKNQPEIVKINDKEYEGFTEEQIVWLNGFIDVSRLPTRSIDIYRNVPKSSENENWLGSVNYADRSLSFYGRLGDLDISDTEPASTAMHELGGHGNCPLNEDNDANYGSEKERKAAKEHARQVAEQTYITGIPLNGYHAQLLARLKPEAGNDQISIGRFFRETHAIMVQMRVFNYQDLLTVEDLQREEFEKLVKVGGIPKGVEFAEITGSNENVEPIGVDRTLAALWGTEGKPVPLEEVYEIIDEINQYAEEKGNPFRSDLKEALSPQISYEEALNRLAEQLNPENDLPTTIEPFLAEAIDLFRPLMEDPHIEDPWKIIDILEPGCIYYDIIRDFKEVQVNLPEVVHAYHPEFSIGMPVNYETSISTAFDSNESRFVSPRLKIEFTTPLRDDEKDPATYLSWHMYMDGGRQQVSFLRMNKGEDGEYTANVVAFEETEAGWQQVRI